MAQFSSKKTIVNGIDLDGDEARIAEDKAKFIKGLTMLGGKNPDSPDGEGNNTGVWIPYSGSELVGHPQLPIGDNYCIGTYYSKETNELYCFVYNSRTNHSIYRINGDGTTQIVYKGYCLNFQYDPQYYISEGRCVLRKQLYFDTNGIQQERKLLIFTDYYNDQRFISVEDSIATDSFNPDNFPYFNAEAYACNPCYLINLGVPTPMRCIGIDTIVRTDEEKSKQNLTVNNGWQIRIKQVDIFGRQSEHGIISNRYFTIIGGNCVQANNNLPRCYMLTIDAGCPLVDKIQIEFRKSNAEQWFKYDVINKYNDCDNVPWYERSINSNYNYDPVNNTFGYTFCGDKECEPIDEAETSRLFNPLSLKSSGLMAINRGIGLSNNVRGFEPLDCIELNKINYTVTPPTAACDTNELRTITVYAAILQQLDVVVSTIWEKDIDNATIFWGVGQSADNPQKWGQYFVPGNFGFIGYLAGTQYSVMSRQVMINRLTGQTRYIGILKNPATSNRGPFSSPGDTEIPMQEFTFKVPPGQYSLRIASPLVTLQQSYQATSTNVYGISEIGSPAFQRTQDKEIVINCCAGDVVFNQSNDPCIMIYDCSFGPYTSGQLYEDGNANIPLEYTEVDDETGGASIFTPFTDHNGFFFGVGTGATIQLKMRINSCDAFFDIWTRFSPDKYSTQRYNAYPGSGNNYPDHGRHYIKGRVEICDTNIGIGGALVVCQRGPFVSTDANGDFTLITHQRPGGFSGDYVFLSQSGGCRLTDCTDPCLFCFTAYTVAHIDCSHSPRISTITPWHVRILGNIKGLKNGSKRQIGVTLFDWMGRATFIQSAEKHTVTMPALIDIKQFNFSTIGWTFDVGIKFPDWVKFVTFWITNDLNNDAYLMWVVDSVQFIDNGGGIVPSTAATKIRIYYGSLNAYNKQNNFSTNTAWQIITEDATGKTNNVVGDYVEFVKNGDGVWFDKAITALITYDKDGQFFDLEYTPDLDGLLYGALYYLVRPKQCETDQIFYELCTTVRVFNGTPTAYTGMLPAYDAYFLNRQIPIPYTTTDSTGKTVTTLNATWFSFFFESSSPSDFWGDNMGNRGRINVKNPYEKQIVNGTEVALSKALIDRSNFNGLSYFDSNDVKQFEEQEWGKIVVALIETNVVLFICEHNNFLTGFNDDIVRLSENGNIVAGSTTDRFGNPQIKIGSDYGCQPADINTIRKHNGIVLYLDRNRNAVVKHNYSAAGEISLLGYSNYVARKIATVIYNNEYAYRTHNYMFVAGIDPQRQQYYLTVFGRPVEDNAPEYVNLELEHSQQITETIEIDIASGLLRSFPIFVPEYYGYLDGYKLGKSLFSFSLAGGWAHRATNPLLPFNNFFGVQGKKVLTVVYNLDSEKVKRFMHTEVYCREHKMICDKVVTETKQQSRIKNAWWRFVEKFWTAPFLRNANSYPDPNRPILQVAPVTEGDMLTGRWIKVRYVSEDVDDGKYCEISGILISVIPVEKSGGQ